MPPNTDNEKVVEDSVSAGSEVQIKPKGIGIVYVCVCVCVYFMEDDRQLMD